MASIAASSSSSSSQQQWRYDVFLSFRGEDTRNNYTSHLYKELLHKGIVTFKDDRELPKGGSVPLQLPKAIQDSRILVVIFSKNYANSTWCLNELVEIFECKKGGRQIVLPIFYDVSPSEVRKQEGEFGAPFAEYEKDKIERVQQWRVASTEVANLSGWHLNHRVEAEFIQDIVNDILRKLRRSSRSIAKDFVGMEPRLKKMNDYLDLGQVNKVRIIGICGLGGIGKTTIASVVYKDIYWQFEAYCFLGDVRESFEKDGAVSLQNKLLSAILMDKGIPIHDVYTGSDEIRNRLHHKRVLVVLDDVDKLKQIELLIGKKDDHWFGIGSRVIITTRDEHLLKQHGGVEEIYKVDELNYYDSLKLFCSKACRNTHLEEEYLKLCKKFVKYASGLPLALDILGSSLCGKSLKVWNSTLNRLKEIPNEKVLGKLELSYDGLDQISKQIFLDIACFFKGMEEKYVVKILESCGLFPDSGIGELVDKSLITISCSRYVQMHDLVQEMGREIVRRESYEDPGLRSRIWLDHDVYDIQVNSMEAKHVKAIVLRSWEQEEERLSAKIFSKVKELRLLILQNIPVSGDIEYLSNKLMYLEWHKCPCKFFPSSFQPKKLVHLDMQSSNMEQLWKTSIRPIKSLTVINLSFSENLIKTPDFREVPNLEKLNLEGCESLREVHESIGVLKRLVLLNLKYCVNLVTLPDSMSKLKSLETLILRGCSKLIKLPERLTDLTSLVEIDAAKMGVQQMELANRWDFRLLSWLTPWTWKNPHPMAMVFSSLSTLPFLEKLNLSYCNIPEGSISSLSTLPFLKELDLSYCNILEGSIPGLLSLIKLSLCGNNIVSLPSTVSHLSKLIFPNSCFLPFQPEKLVQLDMQCGNMEQLWKTSIRPFKSLTVINLSFSKNLIKTPDFREVPNLEKLNLEGCESLREVHQSIGVLKRLFLLNLKCCINLVALPDSMNNLKSLTTLILRGCSKLIKLPERLGDMTSLVEIDAAEMGVQQMELAGRWDFHLRPRLTPWTGKNPHRMAMVFSSLSTVPFLKQLDLSYCNIPEGSIPTDLSGLLSLEVLCLCGNDIVSLPSSFSHLSKLIFLEVSHCRRLQSLPDLPSSITHLFADNCISLETLPNSSDKDNLTFFRIECINCSELKDCKRNISAAFALLRSCLISFLKCRWLHRIMDGLERHDLNKIFHKTGNYIDRRGIPRFMSFFPGNEIPEWFTCQCLKSSLEIRLASCEKWRNITGFMFCFVVSAYTATIPKYEFKAYSKKRMVYLNSDNCLSDNHTILKTEHLFLSFVPNYLLDIYEEESPTKLLLIASDNVKKCGIRVVHDKEIQELMESSKPLENLDPDASARGSRGWRSYSSEGEEEDVERDLERKKTRSGIWRGRRCRVLNKIV